METCPNCAASVPDKHINHARFLAVCPSCNHVFRLDDAPEHLRAVSTRTSSFDEKPKRKTKHSADSGKPDVIAPPTSLIIREEPDRISITRRWATPAILPLLFFTIFWDGFMVVWYTIAITQQQWEMAAFGTIHGAIGLALLYHVLSTILNRTTLTVTHEQVKVVTTPIYRHAPRVVAAQDLEQVFVRRQNNSIAFEVYIYTYQDGEKKFMSSLTSYQEAAYIERAVETFLGIRDERMANEYTLYA